MMEEYKPDIFNREGLGALGIYELRELARSLGVVSPTSKDKPELIEEILQIIYGENYDSLESLTKGRPAKHKRETDWLKVLGADDNPKEVFYNKLDRNFQGSYSFVATPMAIYKNDAQENSDGIDSGILRNENFQYVIKTFKSSGNTTINFPYEFVEKYKISDGDIVTYRIENGLIVEVLKVEKI